MRRPCSRCRSFPLTVSVLAAVLAICLATPLVSTSAASAGEVSVFPLDVEVDRPLSLVDEETRVTIGGGLPTPLAGTRLVVKVEGPAEPSQVGQSAPELPEAGKIAVDLGVTPILTVYPSSLEGVPADGSALTGVAGSAATLGATARIGPPHELEAGVLEAEVTIPSGLMGRPGAYLVVAELKSAGVVIASGRLWVGKALPRETPLDLAFVWPASLGIHRDADGVFFDQVLAEAVSAGEEGDLLGLLTLAERFPGWHFTLALEPVLLTQLRDMADGYAGVDGSGAIVDHAPATPPAQAAAEAMETFKGLALNGGVELLVGPYSGADLALLAAEGWPDGVQQLQLGKQEMQQSLGLGVTPKGGHSPGFGLTAESLSFYAQASIDYAVVSETLVALLTEPLPEGTDAVRARNADNDRLTLVFADSALSARMAAPWDPSIFPAALAAELVGTAEDALVIAPDIGFSLVPKAYLDGVGQVLEEVDWVRTQTLAELLRAHGPDTRPVLLRTAVRASGGYIEESQLAGLRVAHGVVEDLTSMADPTRAPVEEVLRLLFMAQSRWWSRPGISPLEATIGMTYAERARLLAGQEMEKVRFLASRPASVMGSRGTLDLVAENDAGYPLTVTLALETAGVSLPGGSSLEIELAAGRTTIPVQVVRTGQPCKVQAVLLAGDTTLDETAYELRFFTIVTALPWLIAAGALVLAALFLVAYRSRRRHRTTRAV